MTHAEERFHDAGRWHWAESLSRSLRFGMRMIGRNRGSSLVAILVVALGIGANTAIFSLLHAVLLRSLPVARPGELVLFGKGEWVGSMDELPNRSWQLFSYPAFRDFRGRNHVFSDVAAVSSILFTTHGRVGGAAQMEKISAELVSGSYFPMLGVKAAVGRVLTDADDVTPGGHPVAVASYAWWQRRLARGAGVLGARVAIGTTVYRIVGVAAPEFFGTTVGQAPDLWIPLAMQKEISPGWNGLEKSLFQSLYVMARLKPGVTRERAQANVNVLFQQMLHGYVDPQPSASQLAALAHAKIELTPAATGLSQFRQQMTAPLEILMAVAGVVLLIACANVANLLLARAAARQREIAIRMSIGAGRRRLVQQLLVESGLLGLAGAALGIALAWGADKLLLAMAAGSGEAQPLAVGPDAHVLGFTLFMTILTVLGFGTVPALRATRVDLAPSLKEGRGMVGGQPHSLLARGLLVGQVALSLALLGGAGLFLRSLANLMHVDTGFDKRNVLVLEIDPVAAGYRDDDRLRAMMQEVEANVSAVPGVEAASFAFMVFAGGGWTEPVTVSGRSRSDRDPDVDHNIVGSQYLRAMRIPVLLGRGLSERDTAASRRVAVINEAMARVYFPDGSPLGRTFSVGGNEGWRDIEVVGVAKNAKYMDVEERQRLAAFYPYPQHHGFLYNFVVRHAGGAKAALPRIRRAVGEVDANLPVGDVLTLEQLVDRSVVKQRVVAQLSTLFALLAALLASVGIYGVTSYAVARRTNEIGVRMALGAQRADVLWMVLRETLRLALAGGAVGIALALTFGALVERLLFGLKPADPAAIGAATGLMIAVALLAGWVPARRATRIDPMAALRCD